MERISVEQVLEMQKRQWAEQSGTTIQQKPVQQVQPAAKPTKPNAYLNVVRKDIVCLKNIISEAGWSPVAWYRNWKYRQSGEYRDFMDRFFPGKPV